MIIVGIVAPNSYPSPEGGQHITLAYLGSDEYDADIPPEFVQQLDILCSTVAAHTSPFDVPVEAVGVLGDSQSLFLAGDRLVALRDALVGDSVVKALMSTTEQYPSFTPHMAISYDEGEPTLTTISEPLTVVGLSLWGAGGQHDFMFDDPNGVIPVGDIETSIIATAGNWDPSLHPRGKDGKFIKKFGIIKFLDSFDGKWSYGQVVGIERDKKTKKPKITVRPSDLGGKPTGKPDIEMPPSKIYAAPKKKAHLKMKSAGVKKIGGQGGSNPGGMYELPAKKPKKAKVPEWVGVGATTGILDDDTSGKLALAAEAGEYGFNPKSKVWSFDTPEGKEVYVRNAGAQTPNLVKDNGDLESVVDVPDYSEKWTSAELGKATDVATDKFIAELTKKYGAPTFTYEKGDNFGKKRPYGLSGYKVSAKGSPVLSVGLAKKSKYKQGFIGAEFYEYNPETGKWREFTPKSFGMGQNYYKERTLEEITSGVPESKPVRVWDPVNGTVIKATDWVPPTVALDDESAPEKYYIKKAKTADHGRNEALANALYEEAGVYVPEVDYDEEDGQIYSKIVTGEQDMNDRLANKDTEWMEKVQSNFAVDAWLANWDVFGLTQDNIMTDENGEPVRIDNGGALAYRAMGGPKGTAFGSKVSELDTMRSGGGGVKDKIYGASMPKSAELDGAQRILAISPERIEELVAQNNMGKSMADTLKARRKYIADYYGLPLPETMQPAGSDHLTSAPLVDPLDASGSNGMPRTWTSQITDVSALTALVEPGDQLKTAKGVIDVGKDPNSSMILAVLDADGGPIQLKKKEVSGPRPTHNGEMSTAPTETQTLLNMNWQRGDRIEIEGTLLDVIGVNRSTGTMVVSTPGSDELFPMSLLNLPGDKIVTKRWDPEAASDILPQPSVKTGLAAKGEKELKEDLIAPLPDGGPPKPNKTVAKPGAGIGKADKKNVKSTVLGDGTTAATGDHVISKKDGKEWVFVKPKGQFSMVYEWDPTDPNPTSPKLYQKTTSTLTQPDKEPVIIPGLDTPKPTSSNGVVPEIGLTVTAKDGKTGKIVWVSPDGKSLQFVQEGDPKKIRKSTSAVSIEKGAVTPEPEPAMVAPGTPSAGTPGLPGHVYGDMAKADVEQLDGDLEYIDPKDLVIGQSLVFTAAPSGDVRVEKWANQPSKSLLIVNKKIAARKNLGEVSYTFKTEDLPALESPDDIYNILYQGHSLYANAAGFDSDGSITAVDANGAWFSIPAGSEVIASKSMSDPVSSAPTAVIVTVLPEVEPLAGEYDFKPLSKLLGDGKFTVGAQVSPDGKNWYEVKSGTEKYTVFESESGDYVKLANTSKVDFLYKPAVPKVDETPKDDGGLPAGYVTMSDVPKHSLVSTWGGVTYVHLGKHLYLDGNYTGASDGSPNLPVQVVGDLEAGPVQLNFGQLRSVAGNFITGTVEVNGKKYETYAAVTDPAANPHIVLKDVESGDWVDGTEEMFAEPVMFTMTSTNALLFPPEADPLLEAIMNSKPWITPKDVAPGGPLSKDTLVLSLGENYSSPVDIYLTADGELVRTGPTGEQIWNKESKTWDVSSDPSTGFIAKTLAIAGTPPPPVLLNNGVDEPTYVVPQYANYAIYDLTYADGSVHTAYKVGDKYKVMKASGWSTIGSIPPENIKGEKLLHDPWAGSPEAVPATEPKYYASGYNDAIDLPTAGKVVEFAFPDGNKAYAIKEDASDDFWDVYGGKDNGLPPSLNDKSLDKALSNENPMYAAKLVYTGPDYKEPGTEPVTPPEPGESPKTFKIGTNAEFPASTTIYKVPGAGTYWVKTDEGWDAYLSNGWKVPGEKVADAVFQSAFFDAYTEQNTPLELVSGVEAPKEFSVNGYTPQPGEKVLTHTYLGSYVQPVNSTEWFAILDNGELSAYANPHMSPEEAGVEWAFGGPEPVDTKPDSAVSSHVLTSDFTIPTTSLSGAFVGGPYVPMEDLFYLNSLTKKKAIPAGTKAYIRPGWKYLLVVRQDGTGYRQEYGWLGGNPTELSTDMVDIYLNSGDYKELDLKSFGAPVVAPAPIDVTPEDQNPDLSKYTSGVASYSDIVPGMTVYHEGSAMFLHITAQDSPGVLTYDKFWSANNASWSPLDPPLQFDHPTLSALKVWSPNAPAAPATTPAAPVVPKVDIIPGVTVADAAATAEWGGDLTKTGHVPYFGMAVTGIGGLDGQIVSFNKDKTKATVLKNDGTKTTRKITALKSNTQANYSTHLGPVEPLEIPEGMTLPYPPPHEVFNKVLTSPHPDNLYGLVNGHKGIRNGVTHVRSALAPSGKKFARVHFQLTTAQRAELYQRLQQGEPAKGAWKASGEKELADLAVGDVIPMRYSNKESEWIANATYSSGKYKLTEITPDGLYLFENIADGTLITTPFTKKISGTTGQPYKIVTEVWDPEAPALVSASHGFSGLSTEATAQGWTVAHDHITSGFESDGLTLQVEPGSPVSNANGVFPYSTGSQGFRLKLADGTVIETTTLEPGHNSTYGAVTISIPEGGDTVAAYASAMSAIGMAHAPHTQENVKEQIRPILKNLVELRIDQVDNTKKYGTDEPMSDEEIFQKVGSAIGIADVGWQDVRVGMTESQGKVTYYWSDRVISAIGAKNKWKVLQRGASGENVDSTISAVKRGGFDSLARRYLGYGGNGISAGPDAANNAGHGSFMSGGTTNKFDKESNSLGMGGGKYLAYHHPSVLYSKIADYRVAPPNADAWGTGPNHAGGTSFSDSKKGNTLNALVHQSKSGDIWVGTGLGAEDIGFFGINKQSMYDAVMKGLAKDGITHIGGRPVTDVIMLIDDLNKKHTLDDLPPWTAPPGLVNLVDLPETAESLVPPVVADAVLVNA